MPSLRSVTLAGCTTHQLDLDISQCQRLHVNSSAGNLNLDLRPYTRDVVICVDIYRQITCDHRVILSFE